MRDLKKILSIILCLVLASSLSMSAFSAPKPRSMKLTSQINMLNRINDARKDSGLKELAWDNDLTDAAQIRANEIAVKYSKTRPNGQKFLSVSTKVWAENLSRGQKSEKAVMKVWTSSEKSLANILDKRFTIVGVACAEGDDGKLYWVQHFGTGKSNVSWAMRDDGVKTYTLDPLNDPNAPMDTSDDDVIEYSDGLVDKDGNIISSALNAELKKKIPESKNAMVTVKIKNAKSISPAAIQSASDTAAATANLGFTVFIQVDTMTADGKSVQGRMVFEPFNCTGSDTDLKLGVYVDEDSVAPVKRAIEKRFSGRAEYIRTDHIGSYGKYYSSLGIGAMIDMTGMSFGGLRFYTYDEKTDKVKEMEFDDGAGFMLQNNNFISFDTYECGYIVITDQAL